MTAATWWDADGPGPDNPKILLGGEFGIAGESGALNLALYDPVSGRLGSVPGLIGLYGTIYAVAILPSGDVVVGGSELFSTGAGGQSLNALARWNGTQWVSMGTGAGSQVLALKVLPSGELAVGGTFDVPTLSSAVQLIARWDGASWSTFGTGLPYSSNTWVQAIAVHPNGTLFVGGMLPTRGVAQWNGTQWQVLGSGASYGLSFGGYARALAIAQDGKLIVGGSFTAAGGVPAVNLATWDGTAWSALGTTTGFPIVRSILELPGNVLVATSSGPTPGGVWRFENGAWSALGSCVSSPSAAPAIWGAIELPDQTLLIYGDFHPCNDGSLYGLAILDGSTMRGVATGTDGQVNALLRQPDGAVVAGGGFLTIQGVAASHIASFGANGWTPLGSGLGGTVRALCWRESGNDLFVAGSFSYVGNVAAPGVAIWLNSTWHSGGAGLRGTTLALANGSGAQMLAGGSYTDGFGSSRDGVWGSLGSGWTWYGYPGNSTSGDVYAMVVPTPGQFIVAGDSGMGVRQFNGSSWASVGTSYSLMWTYALTRLSDGRLLAGGLSSRLQVLNGTTWSTFATLDSFATVRVIKQLPDGRILIGGAFQSVDGVPASNLAVWNGSNWSPIAGGVDGTVLAIEVATDGSVFVGGDFGRAGGRPSRYIARFIEVCGCAADLDNGTGTGVRDQAITIDDLLYFLVAFEAGTPEADLDNDGDPAQGEPDAAVTIEDLLFFIAHFEGGC